MTCVRHVLPREVVSASRKVEILHFGAVGAPHVLSDRRGVDDLLTPSTTGSLVILLEPCLTAPFYFKGRFIAGGGGAATGAAPNCMSSVPSLIARRSPPKSTNIPHREIAGGADW